MVFGVIDSFKLFSDMIVVFYSIDIFKGVSYVL